MEILFPAARCPLLGIGLPPAFINNILMNIPFEIHFPSVQSGIPYQSLFLNKFSCAYKNAPLAISDNYRPTMNIHNDRTPQANSLSSYRGRGHVYSRKRVCIPREMVRPWDGFNWISNRKRIVKTRFGYVFVSKGDVSGSDEVCVLLARLCIVISLSLLESRFLSFSSCAVIRFKGDMKKKKKEKNKCALINLRVYFRIV